MVTTLKDGEISQIMDTFERSHYDITVQFPHPDRNNKNLLILRIQSTGLNPQKQ